MKLKKIIIALIFTILSSTIYAQNSETYIGKTTDGKSEYYLINNTIKKSDYKNEIYAWIKEVYVGTIKIKGKFYKEAYKMQRVIIDCEQYKLGISDGLTYNKNGTLIESYHFEDYNTIKNPTAPNTIGNSIVETICNYTND